MWQRLRDYWIPKALFTVTVLVGLVLALLVALLPFVVDVLPERHPVLILFGEDTTVRRSALAAAVGLMITAFVFFRPHTPAAVQKRSSRKSSPDSMAGA